jgi:hypothetical protein
VGALLVGAAITVFYVFTWATYMADLSYVGHLTGREYPHQNPVLRMLIALSPLALAAMTVWFGVRHGLGRRPRPLEWVVWSALVLGSLTEVPMVLVGLLLPHGVAP